MRPIDNNPTRYDVTQNLSHYSTLQDSLADLREFSITLRLKEGYEDLGSIHTTRAVSDAAKSWMQERAARRQPFLSGILQEGDILYAHPIARPPYGSAGEEPVVEFKGLVSPLYNSDLTDEEVMALLNELASLLGNVAGQTRVYVTFQDSCWVLQQDGKSSPRGDYFTAAQNALVDLHELGQRLISRKEFQIDLIPSATSHTRAELRSLFRDGRLYVCDFYLDDIETEHEIKGGYYSSDYDIVNIDHHAPHDRMYRHISSGNLACEYVRYGTTRKEDRVIINHTDCDSVLSSLIMRGHLPPLPLFEEAVIAADHTGKVNPIADLLQALDVKKDLAYSARNLGLLLMERPLDQSAQALLNKRERGREETRAALLDGDALKVDGQVALVHLTDNMRNEFMPTLLPEAAVIMTYEEIKGSGRWACRLRLGQNAPDGFTLNSLHINENIDPNYGGRWNAGANKRGGGTNIPIAEYHLKMCEAYNRHTQTL